MIAITDAGNIPAYGLFNPNANRGAIAGSPVVVALFVTNVADTFYVTSYADFTPTLGLADRVLGEPRMFGGRVRYRFGNRSHWEWHLDDGSRPTRDGRVGGPPHGTTGASVHGVRSPDSRSAF